MFINVLLINTKHMKQRMDGQNSMTCSIPSELNDFFSSGGRSLILKGAPGTGKTTLALELLRHFRSSHDPCFISGRIDETTLREHLPWIDPDVLLARGDDESARHRRKGMVSRSELDRLESRVEEGDGTLEGDYDPGPGASQIEKDAWTIDVMALLPEMDRLYDRLETARNGKIMVAIDSIDSLAEKYGIAPKRLIFAIQKDLVEHSNANVIFILETSETNSLDFMGDGVVSLEMDELEGRRLRLMRLEKLRGQRIFIPTYAFSLAGGHFDCFGDSPSGTLTPEIEKIQMDGYFSNLTESGKYTVFEIDGSVPANVIHSLAASQVMEAASVSRGVYTTPSLRMFGRLPPELPKQLVGYCADAVRFISPVSQLQRNSGDPCTVPVDGESFFADFDMNGLKGLFPESRLPPVFLMDANQLLSQYGRDSLNDIETHISHLLRSGGTCVGFHWPGNSGVDMNFGMSHRLIKVKTKGPHVLVFGEKPHSPVFVLASKDQSRDLELRPLL